MGLNSVAKVTAYVVRLCILNPCQCLKNQEMGVIGGCLGHGSELPVS